MPHRFKCPTCSKWHEGFPDVAYDRPYYVTEVPDAEFASRVFLTSDLCVLDDTHFFVRSVLPFRIRGAEDDSIGVCGAPSVSKTSCVTKPHTTKTCRVGMPCLAISRMNYPDIRIL